MSKEKTLSERENQPSCLGGVRERFIIMVKYIVKLNMVCTQDCVRPYIKEIEKSSLKEARRLIRDLQKDYKSAFKKHSISYEYDFQSVQNKVIKVKYTELCGLNAL